MVKSLTIFTRIMAQRQFAARYQFENILTLIDRRMSWIVSKGRAAIFLSLIEDETSVKSHALSKLKKISAMILKKNHDFSSLRTDCPRLTGYRIVEFTYVLASIHDRKTKAGRFDTLSKIL